MRFFDAHNHLQDDRLAPYLPGIVTELGALGIAGAVVNGIIERDWENVARLAWEYDWIVPSYGVHPWRAAERSENWEAALNARLDQGGIVGEIGLDRWKDGLDLADQERLFRTQLQMAVERNIPATIHCLRAWGPLWDIVRSGPIPACGFLLHAYGGPAEMIGGFVKHGGYFSFNPSFLAERHERKREAFRKVPLDRLLVETDAPSMPAPRESERFTLPDAADGERVSHPGNIAVAYEGLASLRGMTPEALAAAIEENFRRLFGKLRG